MGQPTQGQQQAPSKPIDLGPLGGLGVEIARLAGLVEGKADASAMLALATLVGGKAASADLTAGLARIAALEVLQGGYAAAGALTAAATRITALEAALATVPQFIASATMTVEALLATYPAAAAMRGKYVRVSNYAGYVDRVLRCDFDANLNLYFWNPTQAEYGRSIALPASGGMVLKRLLSPPSIVLTGGGLLGGNSVTIDLANARPGEIIEIKKDGTTLLSALNILGTGLGSGVALLVNGYQKYVVDGSSGALQLVRLV